MISLLCLAQKRVFLVKILLCILCITPMPGCGLKKAQEQIKQLDDLGTIQGSVRVESGQEGPVIVLRFRSNNGILVAESPTAASQAGDFTFPVSEGEHYIAAFVDANRDGEYQQGEHGHFHGKPTAINLVSRQTITLDPIIISGPFPPVKSDTKPIDGVLPIWKNIGEQISIDDPLFSRANEVMGLWRPIDFLTTAGGGLFLLDQYEPEKVPVLFVHGALGSPAKFKTMIHSIDRQHFQPWAVYYPSGLRLDLISDYLLQAITRLQNKYDFSKFIVVAHSMGGLVTRSFVKKYISHSNQNIDKLGLVMTINSPMEGMSSASSGVRHSPVVVPSWRDVAPDSSFLKDIHTWHWPQKVPYCLIFSYIGKKNGDGLASLSTQIPIKLQTEAQQMFGFNSDHSGILNDESFISLFNTILNKYKY